MMLTNEFGASGLKDRRSLDRNMEASDQKRAPIYIQASFDPDLIDRETHQRIKRSDSNGRKDNTYPAYPTNTRIWQ
ncbi:hypothetical protein LSTR_LSTR003698 [Laodelphax striatellus]|uniref:Uncharacterized protein n=1 Tax=Laodelphax striatellus TaxID=195883 RepID=A0A482XAM5_LAOST|nr:hypothetical protein LSTR_LSTR003698 [Laodelphax striatellus]